MLRVVTDFLYIIFSYHIIDCKSLPAVNDSSLPLYRGLTKLNRIEYKIIGIETRVATTIRVISQGESREDHSTVRETRVSHAPGVTTFLPGALEHQDGKKLRKI